MSNLLPPDIIRFLEYARDCGYAPLDLMAADLLKKYTVRQVGPSEFKDNITWAMPPEWSSDGTQDADV